MPSSDRRLKRYLVLSLLSGISFLCVTTFFAQEQQRSSSLTLTEKLVRKAEIERIKSDKTRWRVYEEGNPIPRTKAQIPEPPPVPRLPVLSDEERRARADEARRNAPKPFTFKMVAATVFDNGYTEIGFLRDNQWFKALVNADLSLTSAPGILETDNNRILFVISYKRSRVDGEIQLRSGDEMPSLGASSLGPSPPLGGSISYAVGYDPQASVGEEADIEILSALLNYYDAARNGGSSE